MIDEFIKGGANTYVVRKIRKTQYKLQKLYLVATYCDEVNQDQRAPLADQILKGIVLAGGSGTRLLQKKILNQIIFMFLTSLD